MQYEGRGAEPFHPILVTYHMFLGPREESVFLAKVAVKSMKSDVDNHYHNPHVRGVTAKLVED